MGLSSKQVSGDGFDWTQCLLQSGAGGIEFSNNPPLMKQQEQQQEQQQLTPLNCPRCDSTNTKFCYYNNYNRSQPRHFCRSCKRHWTKGGTLRNVPIGGGRKNKHLKTTTKTGKKISKFLNQSLISPTLSTHLGSSDLCPSSIPSFQFTSLNNFGNHPSSGLSFSLTGRPQSTNGFDDSDQIRENLSYSSYGNPTTMFMAKEWQVQSTNDFMNSSINWSWEDMSTFITTDLMHPLEVDQIKQ